MKCRPMYIRVDNCPIYNMLMCADDQLVLAEVIYVLNNLVEEYSEWGLEVILIK